MTRIIHAHYDGKHIIPDEPLDLPAGEPLELELRRPAPDNRPPEELSYEEWAERLRKFSGAVTGVQITGTMSRSDNFYDEREPT